MTKRVRLTAVLVVAGLMLLAGACGSDDSDEDPGAAPPGTVEETAEPADSSEEFEELGFTVGTVATITSNLPIFIADQEGFFEDEALELDVVNVQNTPAVDAALASGQADLGVTTGVHAGQVTVDGLDVRLVTAIIPTMDHYLAVRLDSDVPAVGENGATWEEVIQSLKGKDFGVSSGSTPDLYVKEYFKRVGLTVDDYTAINVGLGPSETAALSTGQVEVIAPAFANAQQLAASGQGKLVFDMGKDGPENMTALPNRGFMASAEFLDENPTFAERFHRAISRAMEFAKDPANIATVKQVVLQNRMLPENEHLDGVLADLLDRLEPTFRPGSFETLVEYLKENGTIPPGSSLDPTDLYVPEVIR